MKFCPTFRRLHFIIFEWRKNKSDNLILLYTMWRDDMGVLETYVVYKNPAKRSQHDNTTYRNIVAWAKNVACVWPPCCDMLRHVGCCWFKFENVQTWAKHSQHVATCRNTVAKRTLHVVPKNVAIYCVGVLPSFDRGLKLLSIFFLSWKEYW